MFRIQEVCGVVHAQIIATFNAMEPSFPPLEPRHLSDGLWWLAYDEADQPIGFAGMVPFIPFAQVAYFKRAFVVPDHRGQGIQRAFITVREDRARQLGITCLVSDCAVDNIRSAANFHLSGFELCDPEQKWCPQPSFYWVKDIR